MLAARGRVFLELRHFERAGELFGAAVAAAPMDVDARFLLALALFGAGRTQEAERELACVAAARPADPLPLEFLARTAAAGGRRAEAAAHLERALELDPAASRAANQLGMLRLELGLRAEALAAFDAALAADPGFAIAHFNAGVLRAADGELDRAALHLECAAELSPDDADPAEILGGIERERGDLARAWHWFSIAADRAPERAELWLAAAECALQRGDVCNAEGALAAAVDHGGGAGPARMLARVLRHRGRPEVALAALSSALRGASAPEAALLHREIADLAEDLGDARVARDHLALALDEAPPDAAHLGRLSDLSERVGDVEGALEAYRELVARNDGGPESMLAIAERMTSSAIAGVRDPERGLALAVVLATRGGPCEAAALLVVARAEAAAGNCSAATAALQRAAALFASGEPAHALLTRRAEEVCGR